MKSKNIFQIDLCQIIGRKEAYISQRLNGKSQFELNEVYLICDCLEIDYTQIPIYFPKDGMYVDPNSKIAHGKKPNKLKAKVRKQVVRLTA